MNEEKEDLKKYYPIVRRCNKCKKWYGCDKKEIEWKDTCPICKMKAQGLITKEIPRWT